ncbi:MAG TPA: ABC transporter permease [Candidatus Sulfotelmatobacter sp.]|nr:ABC transporter permease [Candidatus Sulfotelmatobacter sp.]
MKSPFHRDGDKVSQPRKPDKQRDLEEELDSHLKMSQQDRQDRGESPQQAAQSARREFGNVALVQHVTRDQWRGRWLDEFLQDFRFAVRTLRKSPGFTAIAILTLALGIGANSSLFSVVNAVLLNPIPYPHPEQLVMLHESKPNFRSGSISYPNFRDWQHDNHSFSSMAVVRSTSFTLTGLGETEELRAQFISSDYFSLLAVRPVVGRFFRAGEDEIGAPPIVLVSENFWHRKLSGSADALGKTLNLDGKSYTIVGVTPASFELFQRVTIVPNDLFVPIGQWSNPLLNKREAGLGIHGIGRLKPGVNIEQATADMQRVTDNLAQAYPVADKGIGATLVDFRKEMLGDVQSVLLVLLGAVGFVLLIACANVANLLLARSTGRTREFAIRVALGAGRSRLVRQLLTESLLLALSGGALGLLLAQFATRAAVQLLPVQLPRAADIEIDGHVLFFTAGISLLAGILFGIVPALRTSHPHLHDTLKEGGRGGSGSRNRAQGAFVVAEMAMALVLLVGAGLMVRSLVVLWRTSPGFEPANLVTFGLALPPSMLGAHPDAIRSQVRDLDRKFAATPGVEAASQSWAAFPLSSDDEQLFWIDGEPKPATESDMKWTLNYVVQPDYLNVMKIPLKRGRFFNAHDDEHSPFVAVVDQEFAHKYLAGENPIGKRIHMAHLNMMEKNDVVVEIVGVVGHVNQWGLDSDFNQELRAQIYFSCLQMPDDYIVGVPGGGGTFMAVRSALPTEQLVDAMRRTSREINSDQAVYNVQTMDSVISASLAARRFSMILLASFAALALLLASIGIFGVISYVVGQKTREIGLRIALGASRSAVLRMILTQGGKLAAVGVIVGLGASFVLTRSMEAMLFGVSASDPFTFIAVAALLTTVALAACYLPARRAMLVDPMVALRHE